MLPGGMMPVAQLVAVIRNTPPQSAAGLLTAMPADRLPVVVAAMRPADIARLLPATRPDFRGPLVAALSADQLIELLRTTSADQAVALLSTLPHDRLSTAVDGLSDQAASVLIASLPADWQTALLGVMDRRRTHTVLSRMYERDVADALERANADVSVPDGAPDGILLAHKLGWRIAVAARYGDDGRTAVRDAEDAAYRLRASGALSVTNRPPADDVLRYCRESQRQGRLIDAVAWTDTRHDSPLKRTLVRLFQ
jgi:MgtE intracellular N domain